MRVVLRADSGLVQGAGHVMRCLTLGSELIFRGHEVILATNNTSVSWLSDAVTASGVQVVSADTDSLDVELLISLKPDWVVVDSYRIAAESISALAERSRVLAIIDGGWRGITAALYLEQNLGSQNENWPDAVRTRLLAGSKFALVRREILERRRSKPWKMANFPRVVAFMGGTDPTGSISAVAHQLTRVKGVALTLIVPAAAHKALATELADATDVRILPATNQLPELLADADVVVSAAGTSSWDICSLQLPSVLLAIVDNQSEPLDRATAAGVALGINVFREGVVAMDRLVEMVERLLSQEHLRQSLSLRCLELFDGLGAARVVQEMEIRHHD